MKSSGGLWLRKPRRCRKSNEGEEENKKRERKPGKPRHNGKGLNSNSVRSNKKRKNRKEKERSKGLKELNNKKKTLN